MAELGVIASGAGLASLAIQLGDSAMKLKRFCEKVRSAPQDLRDSIFEIETLCLVLRQIERDPPHTKSNLDPAVMMRCLEMCSEATARIEKIATALQNSIERHKISGAVKTALKEREMQDFFSKLERAKSTLLLAHQMYVHERQDAVHEQQAQKLESISVAIFTQLGCCEPPAVDPLLGERGSSGVVRRPARSHPKARQPARYLRMRLPFMSTMWQFSATQAPCGWDFGLRSFTIIPESSPIFRACERGDLAAVRGLLNEGEASVHDQDKFGWTPLHVR